MKNKSFTLIELLVVIVIIGILAGVIIVSVSSSINKANFAKAQSFSNTVQNELLGDLVSEWTFNSPAVSGKTEDSWGNNDGTLYGANGLPELQTKENCVYGTCYLFDGVDDYINCGNSSSLLFSDTDDVTISLWFKKAETQSTYPVLLGRGDWNTNNSYSFHIYYNTLAFNVGVYWGAGASVPISYIKNDIWYYVVGVATEIEHRLYVNGNLVANQSVNKSSVTSGEATLIGAGRPTLVFKGSIDNVRINNAALSASQIKQEYVAGLDSLLANNNISKEEYNQRINSLAHTD